MISLERLKLEWSNFQILTHVGYVKSKHINDKSPLEGAWSNSRDLFKFCSPQ